MAATTGHMTKDSSHTEAVRVELTGLTRPATFKGMPYALAALWEAIRVLPLPDFQADCFRYFLTRPDAAERALEFLERDADLALTFTLPESTHTLRMTLAQPVHGTADAPRDAPEHRPGRAEAACGCAKDDDLGSGWDGPVERWSSYGLADRVASR